MENWLKELKNHRKKIYSQCGEEGFIEFILNNIPGINPNSFSLCELGAGDGVRLSNTRYFIESGKIKHYELFDGNPGNSVDVKKMWIDKDSVYNLTKPVDLLLIDLDGNDWHILQSYFEHIIKPLEAPKLIVCEINPLWKRDEARVIEYNPSHVWKNNTYYGMSLKSAEILMETYYYTLVFVNDSLNAYFLRNDQLPDPTPQIDIEYRVKKDHPNGNGPLMEVDEQLNLKPL